MLHCGLRLKAFKVAENRRNGSNSSVVLKAKSAIFFLNVAVDLDLIPSLCMADIVDWNIIVLAPKERHLIERRALPKHVQRRGLPLAFGDNPVLDADVLT